MSNPAEEKHQTDNHHLNNKIKNAVDSYCAHKNIQQLLPQDELCDNVLTEVKKIIEISGDEQATLKHINNIIRRVINDYISGIEDDEKTILLVNNYINNTFKNAESYSASLKQLEIIIKYLDNIGILNNPDIIIRLVENNEILFNLIKKVFEANKKFVIEGYLEDTFNNPTIISLIEIYCSINDIQTARPISNINEFKENNPDYESSTETYLNEIHKIPLLSPKEEYELFLKIRNGDEASKKKAIESNLRLVANIAQHYQGRGLMYLDLIQEGNIGLIKAVDKFDVTKYYKFSTYATWWIRETITRAIADKGRNVRLPVHYYEKLNAFKKVYASLENDLDREPTVEEISAKMNISINTAIALYKSLEDTISLNEYVGDDHESQLGDFIPDKAATPEDEAAKKIMIDDVRKLLIKCNLTRREIFVLSARFGLNGEESSTLETIGKELGITRERVRQIEEKAKNKIRKSKYVKSFAIYMQNPEKAIENIDTYRQEQYENNKNKKEKEIVKMKKLQTIYEYFGNYTKKQVDIMISRLTPDEQHLLKLRYGDNLDNNGISKLEKDQYDVFYGSLIPKMKNIISNPNYKPRKNVAQGLFNKNNSQIEETTAPTVETLIKEEPIIKEEISSVQTEKEPITEPTNENKQKNISKEDCEKLLILLRTPTFFQMASALSFKEAIIVSLKLGYIDGKYFSTESIAQFLNIDPAEVIETTKKVLMMYKENLSQIIDDALDMVTEDPLQRKID